MQQALAQTLADPNVRARIEEQGCDVVATGPEECGRFLSNEIERWGKVIRDNDIRVDS
jgi:tripartite-type tricarboxylate transporter receptor subunit TctC